MEISNNDLSNIESGKVLVDFYASWCGPCKMLAPIIDEYCQVNNVVCYKVDVDKNPELVGKFNVMSIPTLVVMENKEEVSRHNGYMSIEQLEEFMK